MIQKIDARDRHFNDYGSMQTYWLFSFSDYYDLANMNFGSLRVFNDDVLQPGSGFPDHPHKAMEIVTIVQSGVLTHTDSTGVSATLGVGEVQRMSAGEGIVHSEFNKSNEPVHLYQLWFVPNKVTHNGYEQKAIDTSLSPLTTLASNTPKDGGVLIHSDAKVFALTLAPNEPYTFNLPTTHGCFVYISEGLAHVSTPSGKETLKAGDQVRITGESGVAFISEEGVRALLIEVVL